MKRIIILSLLLFTAACGGGGPESGLDQNGQLALQVENARAPEGLDPEALTFSVKNDEVASGPLVVNQFRVTVTGDGIAAPIIVTVDGTATRLEVTNVPVGENRTVLVEGLNSDGEVIRRRLMEGVSVTSGETQAIKTALHTVPIILNIKDGGIVLSNHLTIQGFGEPGASLRVEARSEAQSPSVSLNESLGPNGLVISPSLSTGLFEFTPPLTPFGKQTLTLIDEGTGESSSKTITIVRNEDRPGVKITAAGQVGPHVTVGMGPGATQGFHFPLVLRSLSKQLSSETAEVSP